MADHEATIEKFQAALYHFPSFTNIRVKSNKVLLNLHAET